VPLTRRLMKMCASCVLYQQSCMGTAQLRNICESIRPWIVKGNEWKLRTAHHQFCHFTYVSLSSPLSTSVKSKNKYRKPEYRWFQTKTEKGVFYRNQYRNRTSLIFRFFAFLSIPLSISWKLKNNRLTGIGTGIGLKYH